MAWAHSYRASPDAWNLDVLHGWMVGHHDGYARGPDGIIHRRAVWLRPDHYVVVYDEFVGRGRHQLDVNYQFAPGVLSWTPDGGVLFDRAVEVTWVGSHAWSAETRHGGPGPDDGWIAPSLGVRVAAPRLSLTCKSVAPRTTLLTVLAARRVPNLRVTRSFAAPGRDIALLGISGEGYVDWIAASGIAVGPPIDTDALVSICRVHMNHEVETVQIGGTRIAIDAATLPPG
jgi:hypothetical protein